MRFFDPGVYIVVAMVACVHFTYWSGKRWCQTFRWTSLGTSLLPCLLCMGPYLVLTAAGAGDQFAANLPWPMVVPFLCSIYLGSRTDSGSKAFFLPVGGFIVGSLLLSVISSICANNGEGSDFVAARSTWEGKTPFELVNQIDWLGNGDFEYPLHPIQTPRPAGFVSTWSGKLPNGYAIDGSDQFLLATGTPLWHSRLSGIYVRHHHWYRLWTPGGPPAKMAVTARLVEVDSAGTPLEKGSLPGRSVDEFTRMSESTGDEDEE